MGGGGLDEQVPLRLALVSRKTNAEGNGDDEEEVEEMEEMEEEAEEEEEEEEETREVRWRAAFPSDHRHYPRHRRPSRGAVTMALLPSFSTYFFFTRVDRGLAHSASTCSSSSSSSYSDDDGDPVRPRSLRTGSLACYRVCLFVGLFFFGLFCLVFGVAVVVVGVTGFRSAAGRVHQTDLAFVFCWRVCRLIGLSPSSAHPRTCRRAGALALVPCLRVRVRNQIKPVKTR